ncbi:hypothetical protein [Stenotrophomonas sp. UBA7606]|uniref:hypothetical protein n=1 Tax=Stenotrophomonas sp. UBA7606 TaxID=1947559 RepID=UPI0025D4CE0E|nr:hypothetical protein [Stenotrophomonas sp. UBA7606]
MTNAPLPGISASDALNFYWHCVIAAKLIDELPPSTAAKSHALRAVRMATLCATGRNGVQYASDEAIRIKSLEGKRWEKCGLIKEHAFPVSLVCKRVYAELKTNQEGPEVGTGPSENEDLGLTPETIALFQTSPRAWQVALIIREWTHVAWITKEEEDRFDDKKRHDGISIRNRMPKNWTDDQSRFARYDACSISISLI